MRTTLTIALLFTAVVALCSFIKQKAKPRNPGTPVAFVVPKGWPAIKYNLDSNGLTKEGIALGRRLFYDGRLSKDGQFPCASCHQPFAAMANFDHNLSHGFDNQFTTRNAPSLANLAWQTAFHWDGGINHLDAQPLAPITAPNEMAEDIGTLLAKLKKDSLYPSLFRAAFGSKIINTQRMTRALSQFLLTMVSANSKYDKVMRGEDSFILPQKLGYEIFKLKCAACHPEPFFTDFSYRNNGLTLDPVLKDYGRMRITGNSSDSLKFKVPSLRNVYVTYPYMHDGRLTGLYDVLEHYNKKMVVGPTTDSLLQNKIPLSNFEKGQLVAFLVALTDTSFTKDPRFSQPPGVPSSLFCAPGHHLR
ncbi:MAG: cytochrome c peroxidase [Chitinophagaceae bacterium]